jgi:hypothetical protein
VIHGTLPSTDAVLAAQDAQDDGIDAEEVEIQPVRGVEKMPVGTRIEHHGRVYEVAPLEGVGCYACAGHAPNVAITSLCAKLHQCGAEGRDDGLNVMWREVTP